MLRRGVRAACICYRLAEIAMMMMMNYVSHQEMRHLMKGVILVFRKIVNARTKIITNDDTFDHLVGQALAFISEEIEGKARGFTCGHIEAREKKQKCV